MSNQNRFAEMNEILSRHRISEVKFLRMRGRYPRLHGMNAVKGIHGYGNPIIAAYIKTDCGACGWGAATCIYNPGEIRFDRPDICGQMITNLFDAETGILSQEHAIYDIALHDLAGKILNMPVSRLMNPNASEYATVYDGAIYMNDLLPTKQPGEIAAVLEDCRNDYRLGHRMFKIKIGRGHQWMRPEEGFRRDVELIRAIQGQHPDATLLVDANDGYDPESMIRFLEEIYPVSLYWIEEPFLEKEEANRQLKQYLNIHMPRTMVADGENKPNIPQLLELAKKSLVDVIQPDVIEFGFTAWRKLMPELEKIGAFGSPHAWGDVIKTNCCAHLAAAYPRHIPAIEAVLGDTEGTDVSGYILDNGILTIPSTPGFGMEIEWAEEF